MKEKYKKYLPIGSVVLLEEATKRIMITGFCSREKDGDGQLYDYIGCLYPEGVFSSDKNLLFNHDKIAKIFALGYSDEEEKQFKIGLEEAIKKAEGNK